MFTAEPYQEHIDVVQASPKSQTNYDVIVVGSGAGGGMAAYQLAVSGLKVLVLEAGRSYDPVRASARCRPASSARLPSLAS